MRITLVISSVGGGGAERVAATMANYWSDSEREVCLLTMCGDDDSSSYPLNPRVKRRDIGVNAHCHAMPDRAGLDILLQLLNSCTAAAKSTFIPDFNRILALRSAIVQTTPDVVISFIDVTNVRTLLATCGLDIPVIVSEHCDPHHNNIGAGWEHLRRRIYPRAKYLTVLTKEAASYFSGFMNGQLRVLPNPVHIEPQGAASRDSRAASTLLAMGRLAYEKGFDLLLDAFALLADRVPRWCLRIHGEGPLRSELERQSIALGLHGRVHFPGFTTTPHDAMRKADLFVVPSRCEGFSNVLVEAMACGLPVVSFDCPSGPRHIIDEGINGLLVPPQDVRALAASLERLMNDENERRRLGANGRESSRRFSVESVMSKWNELVLDAVTSTGNADVQ